jgi:hypothetical protein
MIHGYMIMFCVVYIELSVDTQNQRLGMLWKRKYHEIENGYPGIQKIVALSEHVFLFSLLDLKKKKVS